MLKGKQFLVLVNIIITTQGVLFVVLHFELKINIILFTQFVFWRFYWSLNEV